MSGRIKKMRRLSLYFRDGTAFPIILEPEDKLRFGTSVIQVQGFRGDTPFQREVQRDALAHFLLMGFDEEEKDPVTRNPEKIEYGDVDLRG